MCLRKHKYDLVEIILNADFPHVQNLQKAYICLELSIFQCHKYLKLCCKHSLKELLIE